MAESTIDRRVTQMETRAEEYVKRSDISATLSRIETALDYHKWILGLLVLGQIFTLGRLFEIF
ncbi:MAG: hypothetical protein OXG68_15505 [Chloroflexi bacterium]|nr:hypothetical protein [Chloroflexota bacterium]MCY3917727.1 hypothetical protein [Chloroflexota bacterium]